MFFQLLKRRIWPAGSFACRPGCVPLRLLHVQLQNQFILRLYGIAVAMLGLCGVPSSLNEIVGAVLFSAGAAQQACAMPECRQPLTRVAEPVERSVTVMHDDKAMRQKLRVCYRCSASFPQGRGSNFMFPVSEVLSGMTIRSDPDLDKDIKVELKVAEAIQVSRLLFVGLVCRVGEACWPNAFTVPRNWKPAAACPLALCGLQSLMRGV